jgi:hypothetical protein
MFSSDVAPRLNHWGERVQVGSGQTSWEYWTPFRIKNEKYNVVDEYFTKVMGGSGFRMPPKSIEGIPLTAAQYNDLILGMNTIQSTLPDGSKGNMLDYYKYLIKDKKFLMKSFGQQKEEINNVKNQFLSLAREEVKVQIQDRIDGRNNYLDTYGKPPMGGKF